MIITLLLGTAIGAGITLGITSNNNTDTVTDTLMLSATASQDNPVTITSNGEVEYRTAYFLYSKELLASSTITFTYSNVTYIAYNGFIPNTQYTKWADATGFIDALNSNAIDGCTQWALLKDVNMANAWFEACGKPSSFESVQFLWVSEGYSKEFHLYNDHVVESMYEGDNHISKINGFLVIRPE